MRVQRRGSRSQTAQPGRAQLSLRWLQLPTQEACPTPHPTYPVEQLLWGQDFAIFIQPEGGIKAASPTLVSAAWAVPSPHGECQEGAGQGAGACYLYVLHSTRREYTESKSLSTSRPAA